MIDELIPSSPPEKTRGMGVPVDDLIIGFLQNVGRVPLQDITKAVGDTTHHVHARIETLIGRGIVVRHRAPGAPRRGPGASVYELA